jgi:hypothetical protein
VARRDHFVIVGAQRCGSTYLTRLLDEHPDIEMAKPLRPEPKFFLDDAKYARGIEFYESEYFSSSARVRGEKSTSYIESELAVERIMACLPDATIVVLLRDPVARAVSNYRFSVEQGVEDLPLDEALRASADGTRPFDPARFSASPYLYAPRGRYIDYLESIARRVPREQIHIVFFESLVADGAVVRDLYERLGIDATFEPGGIGTTVNASAGPDVPIDPSIVSWLRSYYAEPNERLAKLLGHGLPWPS